ncbi:MAG: ABC transporter permease [Vicinamibacterales bacterium]
MNASPPKSASIACDPSPQRNVVPALEVEFAQQLNLANARDLLLNLVKAELTARYKTPVLGMLWFLLSPLVMTAILITVFQSVIRLPIERYPVFLVAALLPWTFFQVGVSNATVAVTRSQALVKRVRIPRLLLPLSAVIASLVHFVISLAIMLLVLLAMGQRPPSLALLALPLLIVIQLFIVCGIGMATAALNVVYRDVEHIVAMVVRFSFWLTPIFYSLDHVPERWRGFFSLNPVTPLLEGYRAVLVHGQVPDAGVLVRVAAMGVALLVLGAIVFTRIDPQLDDYV